MRWAAQEVSERFYAGLGGSSSLWKPKSSNAEGICSTRFTLGYHRIERSGGKTPGPGLTDP
ncbi:hypothetical protein NS506_01572 [Nocardia seriolae]|uniref:Uncharacterized protein n=1 Tax=Nocardia seriolae TaxID=37332 RepID=A0ABC9Z191_9NOCA|nr:hypothetical protein NS506_01572 [Nocardia seriolae]BAW09969.1 hypothetical protein NSERUTF1_6909 [Nocardia seriolae]GAM49388.1 hypothetical protein NS07_v2contig00106-0022 [Nocardia seriolae]GAP31372.1 hypothetical protein NSK11_contig00112-0022 [Nocardia seriolae]